MASRLTEVRYTVIIERDEDGWFVATAPALPCSAQGRTRAVALRRLREAIDSYIAASRAHGWPVPVESEDVVSSLKIAV